MPEASQVAESSMETPTGGEKPSSHGVLRWKSGFWSLIATQFQGGFSDNALKWIISFLILSLGLPQLQRDRLFILIVPELFAIPFILFSMMGGFLADRYSKRSVIIGTKIFEIGTVVLAIGGFLQHSLA